MNIDTFLKIGHSHTICQDYILSGTDPCPYIILADGCSQAEDSDIGARILCHSALNFLKEYQSELIGLDANEMARVIINSASAVKINFNTDTECLDSTLIIAFKVNGYYKIYMFGDGVIYWDNPEGYFSFNRMYYSPNAPAYLRYRIKGYEEYRNSNIAAFLETDRNLYTRFAKPKAEVITLHEGDVKNLIIASDGIESFVYKEEVLYKSMFLSLSEILKNHSFSTNATMSDKVEEVIQKFKVDEKELDFKKVCEEMMDFKLTKGTFLKRRVKKVMREYLKKGFINDDDLSIGCFHEEW